MRKRDLLLSFQNAPEGGDGPWKLHLRETWTERTVPTPIFPIQSQTLPNNTNEIKGQT